MSVNIYNTIQLSSRENVPLAPHDPCPEHELGQYASARQERNETIIASRGRIMLRRLRENIYCNKWK